MDPSRRSIEKKQIVTPFREEDKDKQKSRTSSLSLPTSVTPKSKVIPLSKDTLDSKRVSSPTKVLPASEKTSTAARQYVGQPEKPSLFQRFKSSAVKGIVDFATNGEKDSVGVDNAKRELLELTGDDQLSSALAAVVPKFSSIILKTISKKLDESNKFYKDGLKKALENQPELISDCLNATLLKMMANVARDTKNSRGVDKVSFPDMVSHLLGITESRLQDLHGQIAAIEENIPDEKVRKQKLKDLLEPFKQDILQRLLPNQAADIVLPKGMIMDKVRSYIYAALDDALPDLIIKNYHDVMDPTLKHRTQDEEALKKLPGGVVLNAIADFLAKTLPQKVPGLIDANILPIAEEWTPKLFISEKDQEPGEMKQLSDWLGSAIQQLVTSKNPQINNLWKFSEYYLSPIIKHLFLKMAEKSKADDPNNMLNAISKHLLTTVTTFFEKNSPAIDQALDKMKTATSDQKVLQEKELVRLFEPLSNEIMEMTGLDKPKELPVPTFLSGIISNIVKEQILERVIKLYQDMNLHKKSQVINPNQRKFSEFGEVLISNMMPALIEKVQANAPAALAQALSGEMDEKVAAVYFSEFIGALIKDPSISKPGGYLKEQVLQVFSQILVNIASIKFPPAINIEGFQQVDLLPNLLVQVSLLSKKYLGAIEEQIRVSASNLKNLPPDQQENAKKELIKKFIPLGDKLLELAGFSSAQALPGPGELKPILFNLLRNSVVPGFLLDTFLGLEQSTTDRKEVERNFSAEDLQPVDKVSTVIAAKGVLLLQGALGYKNQQIVEFFNENLSFIKLSLEQQDWLALELEKIGSMQSPAIKDGWAFIQKYIEGLVFKTLVSLSSQYEREHSVEFPRPEPLDIIKQASLQIISLAADGLGGLDSTLLGQIKDLESLSENERTVKLQELVPQFQPLVFKILNSVGIKGPEDLAVPSFVKNILWENLTKSVLPNVIVSNISRAAVLLPKTPIDTQGLKNLNRLSSTIDTLGANIVPMGKAVLEEKREEYGVYIDWAIDSVFPNELNKTRGDTLLDEVIDAKDSSSQKLLDLIPTMLKEFITPLIVNIASSSEIEGDVLERLVSNVSKLISTLLKDRFEFQRKLIGYDDDLSIEDKENKLDQVFGGFVGDVLFTAGLDPLELPENILKLLLEQTYNLYQMVNSPVEILQNYRLQLHKLMEEQSRKVEEQPVENMIGFVADKINEQIKNYMTEQASTLPKLINTLLPDTKLNIEDQEWLTGVIAGIAKSEDAGIKDLWNYIADVLRSTLMKLFMDVANQHPEAADPETAKKMLIPHMLKKIMDIMGTNLQGIQAQVKEIQDNKEMKKEKKEEEMRALFVPLAKEFFKLAGPKALDALPVPDAFKKTIAEELQQKIVPDLLGEVYVDITKWQMHSQEDQEKLFELFKSEYPAAAAKVIGHFASDILPSIISDPSNKLGEKIFMKFSEFMHMQSGESAEALNNYMDQHPDEIKIIIKDNFAQFVDRDLGVRQPALSAIEGLIEAAILKSMSTVFSQINKRQSPDFLVGMGLRMIEMVNEHFAEINKIMAKENKSLAYEVDPEVLRHEFKDLHQAIARNPNLSQEEQAKLLHENFLVPFTEEALKLAGINHSQDLPLPSVSTELREKLFALLKQDLGPKILESIMTSLDIGKVMLSVLELVNQGIENPSPTIELPPEFENDATQQNINKACGELVLNMVNLIPNTAVKALLANDKIRNMPAMALGKIVRNKLMQTNILQLIDHGLFSGLPVLNKKIFNPDGTLNLDDVNLHIEFPETEEARGKERAQKAQDRIINKKKFVKELTKTLRKQIDFRTKEFFGSLWKNLQNKLDTWVSTTFGENAKQIKLAIDKVFRVIFINIIGTFFQIIAYPFMELMGFFLNIHLRRKAQQMSDTIYMDIHRNLVFKLAQEAIRTFQESPAER